MKYVQFFKYDLSNTLSEGCGDRSIVIVDGRLSTWNVTNIAIQEGIKRGYVAWQVFKGEAFTRSRPISQINFIPAEKIIAFNVAKAIT